MKIGVFDSGVGGLTVLKELVKQAPQADYLYFGDTARLPYGSKSAETVAKYTISACKFLRRHGAEMMVIACNTATSLALLYKRLHRRAEAYNALEDVLNRFTQGYDTKDIKTAVQLLSELG